ncbi:MAG TPA: hypothetical protein EYQ11_05350 [Candidatus Poseidoniales archaeon]|jgi:hypothetical protein|nr:hypothetical protein [Candidatus Poseidoniales archaeon]
MNEKERKKILELLSAGTISLEETEGLLNAMDDSPPIPPILPIGLDEERLHSDLEKMESGLRGMFDTESVFPHGKKGGKPRFLKVEISSGDGDNVNVRVPLALARAGLRLGNMIPKEVRSELDDQGIDLNILFESLSEDEALEALEDLYVDVLSQNGDSVRVFCE